MLSFAIPFNSILIYSILNFPKGGYGSVFKAWDLLTSTTVAVKLIDLEGTKYIKDCLIYILSMVVKDCLIYVLSMVVKDCLIYVLSMVVEDCLIYVLSMVEIGRAHV